ncbi:MAG: hypothetical protein AAGD14_09365 [Planctomycetota bacterium]
MLEIDGKEHEIAPGRAYEIEIAGQKRKVRLTPRPYKVSTSRWFSFRFPREYSFEFQDQDDMQDFPTWSVSGGPEGDSVSIRLVQSNARSLDQAVAAGEKRFRRFHKNLAGEKPALERTKAKLEFAERTLDGIRLEDRTETDFTTACEIYAFKHAGRFWILQLDDDFITEGKATKAFRRMTTMFSEHFELKKG